MIEGQEAEGILDGGSPLVDALVGVSEAVTNALKMIKEEGFDFGVMEEIAEGNPEAEDGLEILESLCVEEQRLTDMMNERRALANEGLESLLDSTDDDEDLAADPQNSEE